MKKTKNVEAHVSNTGQPMGDNYGSGVRNKMGRTIEYMGESVNNKPKNMGKKPKTLA